MRKNLIVAAEKTKHAYDVYVYDSRLNLEEVFEVHANNRNQAAAEVRRRGFTSPTKTITSINMTG